MLQIEIFSDIVCPWCYIGKRRFERAHTARPHTGLAVTWRAFQLNPEMPADGIDRQRYLELKFGGGDQAGQVYHRIAAAGAEEGIDFAFDRIRRTPNTVNAHRLVRWARQQDRQDEVVESLFQAYFLEGLDIGEVRACERASESERAARALYAEKAPFQPPGSTEPMPAPFSTASRACAKSWTKHVWPTTAVSPACHALSSTVNTPFPAPRNRKPSSRFSTWIKPRRRFRRDDPERKY